MRLSVGTVVNGSRQAVAGSGTGVAQRLAAADALYGAGKHAEAAKAYEDLLNAAPADWGARNRISLARLDSLSLAKDYESCARYAQEILPRFRQTYAAASLAASGLDCAGSLPEENRGRAALLAEFEKAGHEVAADRKAPVPADDRSSLYLALVDVRGSQVVWSGIVRGESAPEFSFAVVTSAIQRAADLVVPRD